MTILSPSHSIPPLAAARLQRWALTLSAYQYDIHYKGLEITPMLMACHTYPWTGSPGLRQQ